MVWGEYLDTGLVEVYDAAMMCRRLVEGERLALDLGDATGRAHAAWWARATIYARPVEDRPRSAVRYMLADNTLGLPMDPRQIVRLRLVCLHVAGVAP